MEVVIPVPSRMDFDFNSARTTPYSTAPSTPKRFGDFSTAPSTPKRFGDLCFSAPTSPRRASELYRDFQDELARMDDGRSMRISEFESAIPFDWEDAPGTPRSPKSKTKKEDEFAFEFSAELENASLSAEELFDGGKIKPLKPPPGLKLKTGVDMYASSKSLLSPRSPKSPIAQGKKIIQNAFSPRHKKHIDPFSASALQNTSKKTEQERGRERFQTSSNSSRRSSRSVSPYRVSQYPWEEEQQQQQQQQQITTQPATNSKSSSSASSASLTSSGSKGRKWSFKDFLLFRSASEGRASDKDPLKKYSTLFRKQEDVKNSSFRSTDSFNSGSSSKRRGPPISAHELHYTTNRAASENLKKKTFLPYKQGILGRFPFI